MVFTLLLILTAASMVKPVSSSLLRSTKIEGNLTEDQLYKFSIPDGFVDVDDVIDHNGYPVEVHKVKTKDKYLLTMHRIPHGKGLRVSRDQPVVLLQHGVLFSSAVWVLAGPGNGLAYVLADGGYDVWMGNSRGNLYSREHANKTIGSREFWDFSWHEMGKYDLPAEIDFVLKHTGREKLHFIGHSSGATMFYVMCSLNPKYNDKIEAQFSLAPVAVGSRARRPLLMIAPVLEQILKWFRNFQVDNLMTKNDMVQLLGNFLCKPSTQDSMLCKTFSYIVNGFHSIPGNRGLLPKILGHFPAGTSTKTLLHYIQVLRSGMYRQFDYGFDGNMEMYGREEPPMYLFKRVKVPVFLYYSKGDSVGTEDEARELHEILPRSQGVFEVPSFRHEDFLWGTDAKTLLYEEILRQMNDCRRRREEENGGVERERERKRGKKAKQV